MVRATSSASQVTIRRMSLDQLGPASEVIGAAFANNPNALVVSAGDHKRSSRMMRAAVRAAKLGRKCSYVLVAEAGCELVGVLNAAQWPDCQLRPGEVLRVAPAMLKAMGVAIIRQLKITNAWAKRDPRRPHWHLGPIGVLPEWHGRGIGKRLLTTFLEMSDKAGLPAYLETDLDWNVELYQTVGFSVVGHENLMGVDNRYMWRHAGAHQ